MVWSPLSNLLLYGETADVEAGAEAGVLMALGPDWSPSGSKNLLGELKVARLVEQPGRRQRSRDYDLLALATRNAAKILRWDKQLGHGRERQARRPARRRRRRRATATRISSRAASTTSSWSSSTAFRATARASSCGASWGRLRPKRETGSARGPSPPLLSRPAERRPRRRRSDARRRRPTCSRTACNRLPELAKDMDEHPTLDPDALVPRPRPRGATKASSSGRTYRARAGS